MRTTRKATGALLFASLCAGCGDNIITAPYPKNLVIEVVAGNHQFAEPGALAPEPLEVRVTHVRTHAPVRGLVVNWRVVQGAGSDLTDASSATDSTGLAVTRIKLGSALGDYRIEATFPGLFEKPATFTLHTAPVPSITSIEPQSARAGETVVIRGKNFSAIQDVIAVFFDGLRATITASSVGELRAIVPPCVSTRQAQVRVVLGSLTSLPASLDVHGENGSPLQLSVGEVRHFADPASASCVRLPEKPAGAAYLVVTQNAGSDGRHQLTFQLAGVTGSLDAPALYPAAGVARARPLSAAEAWEVRLRNRESELLRQGVKHPPLITAARLNHTTVFAPVLGATRGFNVTDTRGSIKRVVGVVRAVGTHSIIYQDRNAPDGGFTDGELAELARLFDDPIHSTDLAVFGEPSDIDANGRVLVLLTPATNELTLPGEKGYVAGYVNSDDLNFCDPNGDFPCSGNSGEVIYTVVPDPEGKHGLKHTSAQLLRKMPSVLAHEFQHLVHFNQRALRALPAEAPWLMEALAHSAEDTVGGVLLQRGDEMRAQLFRRENYLRAAYFLSDPASVSILGEHGGTLEERGSGWLLLKYLTGHFGADVLARLTQSTDRGTATVSDVTGTPWNVLLSRWAIALHSAVAQGSVAPLDPRYRYTNLELYRALATVDTQARPFQPQALAFSNFVLRGTLPDGGASYALLATTAEPVSLNLSLAGLRGAAFTADARPQLTLLRLR
jgi:IPT/TIG domain-containing protein